MQSVGQTANPEQPAAAIPLPGRHWKHWRSYLPGLEIVIIATIFLAVTSQPAPDVNESHYLVKAKHFWDADYCPNDIFLSSSFSHWAFYICTGWVTQWVSLPTYAWLGRIGTLIFLAIGWRRVSQSLIQLPLMSVVTAAFFLILNERFHLAGEWVVGGFEAKGIAYGFVLWAISYLLQQKWKRVWPVLGAASALHVLVGGWATVAAITCFVIDTVVNNNRQSFRRNEPIFHQMTNQMGQRAVEQWSSLALGLAIAMFGILPPLLSEMGHAPSDKEAAYAVYVSHRIAHHLDFGAFPVAHVSRFVLLVMVGWGLIRWVENLKGFPIDLASRLRRLKYFTGTTLAISLIGLVLSGMAEGEPGSPQVVFANRFLRFYWFRIADFAVPACVALYSGMIVNYWLANEQDFPHQVCSAIFIGGIMIATVALAQENRISGRPNAVDRSLLSGQTDHDRARDIFRNWQRVCQWIETNTPTNAVFMTPADQQTFKWYASRAEVCCWKDIPQDPAAMLEWKRRVDILVEPQRTSEFGIFAYSDQQLIDWAKRFSATHLLALQQHAESLPEPTGLKKIYPTDPSHRSTFVVYEFETGETNDTGNPMP